MPEPDAITPKRSSRAGYGMCEGCGNPLTDAEMLRGDDCDQCEIELGELLYPYDEVDGDDA
jgi:hypothetical protein